METVTINIPDIGETTYKVAELEERITKDVNSLYNSEQNATLTYTWDFELIKAVMNYLNITGFKYTVHSDFEGKRSEKDRRVQLKIEVYGR